MDPSGDDGRGALTATGLSCGSCGTQLSPDSKFCNKCGAPVRPAATAAEYKQVTVLFADVVHSMDIAATVGAERLREIMADLADGCAAVVQRFGGTVDKFTGDGIMAVFGAPVALEDHAVRACLAALGIQDETVRLATEVKDRDGIELRLRVGLNSGQVIAGEIGSGALGYTAVGEHVGIAQRMESVAPPGGVMLSESTARLVEGAVALGEPEMVRIKGADEPVVAERLLGVGKQHRGVARAKSNLVGRRWEMSAVYGLLDRSVDGHGAVVGVVGPPGIGKSRLVREIAARAAARGVDVFPPPLLESYDRNVDARRQLAAMAHIKDTVPPWRIVPPAPADELLGYYRDAEAASGIGWNYLAAINLIETRFGSIDGVSTAGAQGPMQFLPSTFSAYSDAGDIHSPRDSIMAAGRYLAANGFADDRDHAIFRYDNAAEYVRAVEDYAALIAADPAAFAGYYRWDTYYYTTAGDVLLPIGYASTSPIPVDDYLAAHPQ